jgi:transcription antitermination factor NusG
MSKMNRREMMALLAGVAGLLLGWQGNARHSPSVALAKPVYARGDRVRIKDGTFAGMAGEVKDLVETRRLVRVELTIFGRPVPVELDYGRIEHV